MPLRVFPVDLASKPTFSDDFGNPRSGGRTHEGTDIFAPVGSPVLAVDSGRAVASEGKLGGHTVKLQADDGASYYYAHLASYAGPYPRTVTAGDTLGTVGTTGNAAGGASHLHFQQWLPNGARVNPWDDLTAVRFGAVPSPPDAPRGAPKTPPRAGSGAGRGIVALLVLYALSRRG